ncbi:MAG: hypothetical protein QOE27_1067 [Solirubrobacteraceae bacterium]|nr:hypothetical protein [Solirubrobacteraceae bacterium]
MFRCSRSRVGVTVAGAVAAILLTSPGGALADSSPLVTSRPNLTAAQAISPTQVLACFDQILVPTFGFTDASFYLEGYTEGRKTGQAGGLVLGTKTSAGNGFCVVGAFTGPGDARSYSSLVVLANAVNASVPGGGGAGNPQASVPLLGSVLPNTVGATLRPQLVGAAPSAGKTVTFTFNVPLTAAPGTQSFGFYTSADSAFHAGTVTGFSPGTGVTVDFGDADAALFPQATRFVAGEGAVTDANGRGNPVGTIGTGTQRLDLAATSGPLPAAGGLSYHFDFNQALPASAVVCPARYALYDAGGVRYSPVAGTPTISADRRSTTLAYIPDSPGGDPAQITLATVAADGVDATGCAAGGSSAPLNSDGAVALPGVSAKAGATSGPDLVSFQINKGTGFASFVFDAPVSSAGITPGSFHVVDRTGALISPPNQGGNGLLGQPPAGPEVNVGPADTVNVNFSTPTSLLGLLPGPPDVSATRSAIGVTVDEGAVSDATTGVANPVGSLGSPVATTPPTGPTVPPAPTVPVLPKPATTTTKPTVKAACRRVVTIHLLSSISRNIRSATVTINAKNATVSKKLTVTVTFSKYPGVKSLVVRIRAKLKNHKSIIRTKTYKSKC